MAGVAMPENEGMRDGRMQPLLRSSADGYGRWMIIVAGTLTVDPSRRDAYLSSCIEVVKQARETPGCLDFSVTADLVAADRVHVYERWETVQAVEDFRGEGQNGAETEAIISASVWQYEIANAQKLT